MYIHIIYVCTRTYTHIQYFPNYRLILFYSPLNHAAFKSVQPFCEFHNPAGGKKTAQPGTTSVCELRVNLSCSSILRRLMPAHYAKCCPDSPEVDVHSPSCLKRRARFSRFRFSITSELCSHVPQFLAFCCSCDRTLVTGHEYLLTTEFSPNIDVLGAFSSFYFPTPDKLHNLVNGQIETI